MKRPISADQDLIIRKGTQHDIPEMLRLFTSTIGTVCKDDYNREQLEAWQSGAENKERWKNVVKDQYVLIAEAGDQIVGFCTLDQGVYIDLLFVHKDYQRIGIASKLYTLIEQEALNGNKKHLTADVSKTAKLFFENRGFHVTAEQTVNVKGVDLTNYKMEKNLFT
ncbi:GNAT family N-acetyltransferase [Chryseobacterium sp. Tr-659]|uniref:GNAT family N-acetyltransferase n=1 Tax=Chryseobacterium sp. Tr-659 TaxID=2608340 RepID=UPI00141FFA87|nr:GNAT family N-acetyltransferase [Chryseobacterium sp. Tr-659]NIF04222.1 GNAT family N-acetyltransferase [Chryseobacterium sp. Tr-659]